jgi:hypothetical protein
LGEGPSPDLAGLDGGVGGGREEGGGGRREG